MLDIEIGHLTWKVRKMGHGPELLITFHGYGQQSDAFLHYEELLQKEYTFLLIDLAYHRDQSGFPKGFEFDEQYAKLWLNSILKQFGKVQASLMGYSIGARIALSITAWMPEKIHELWVIAPDGLPVSRAYTWLTHTWLGHFSFRRFVKNPGFAFSLIFAGEKLGLISHKAASFYRHEIANEEKRQQLYDTWMAYRKAIPTFPSLRRAIDHTHLSITCILGKHDNIIPYRKTRKTILKKLGGAQIIDLDIGHNLLSDKGVKKLAEIWKT